jgi:opacity protein-like surface antigen
MRINSNRLTAAIILLFAVAIPSVAQKEPAKVEVFGGYAYLRAHSSEGPVNLNGWTISLEKSVNRTLTLVADFDGTYGKVLGERISSHSALFGPQFTARKKRVAPFVHALFGVVRELEAGEVQYGFGMTLGGGMDYDVNRRISFRLAQADYVYGRVDGSNNNDFRFATGVVLKFGE